MGNLTTGADLSLYAYTKKPKTSKKKKSRLRLLMLESRRLDKAFHQKLQEENS